MYLLMLFSPTRVGSVPRIRIFTNYEPWYSERKAFASVCRAQSSTSTSADAHDPATLEAADDLEAEHSRACMFCAPCVLYFLCLFAQCIYTHVCHIMCCFFEVFFRAIVEVAHTRNCFHRVCILDSHFCASTNTHIPNHTLKRSDLKCVCFLAVFRNTNPNYRSE